MTQNEQVAVEQRDVDAMKKYFADTADYPSNGKEAQRVLTETLARHRTRALEASQTGVGGPYRARKLDEGVALGFHSVVDGPGGWPIAHCHYHANAELIAAALTTPTRIEAAQVDVDANRKVALRNLEKSGLRAPTEASQPQEAGERLAIRLCEWSLDGEKPVPLMQEAAAYIRTLTPPQAAETTEQERQALAGYRAAVSWIGSDSWNGCRDCVEILKLAAAADYTREMTPDELAAELKRLRSHGRDDLLTGSHPRQEQDDTQAAESGLLDEIRDALGDGDLTVYQRNQKALGILAKAGKPGEAGNG